MLLQWSQSAICHGIRTYLRSEKTLGVDRSRLTNKRCECDRACSARRAKLATLQGIYQQQ